MKALNSLINFGYTASDILGALSHKNVALGRKITRALNYGYSAANVLSQLAGGKDEDEYTTLEERTKSNFEKQRRKALGTVMVAVGAMGAGTGLLARGLAASEALPESEPPSPEAKKKADQVFNAQEAKESIFKPLFESKEEEEDVSEPSGFYDTHVSKNFPSFTNLIKNLQSAGKTPDELIKTVRASRFFSPLVKKVEDEMGKSFEDIVNSLYSKNPSSSKEDLLHNVREMKKLIDSIRNK